jgi:4-hydroxy-tetrahydrodipicolinate synthase
MGFTASALGGFKTALVLRGAIATNAMGRPLTRYNADEAGKVRGILEEADLL